MNPGFVEERILQGRIDLKKLLVPGSVLEPVQDLCRLFSPFSIGLFQLFG